MGAQAVIDRAVAVPTFRTRRVMTVVWEVRTRGRDAVVETEILVVGRAEATGVLVSVEGAVEVPVTVTVSTPVVLCPEESVIWYVTVEAPTKPSTGVNVTSPVVVLTVYVPSPGIVTDVTGLPPASSRRSSVGSNATPVFDESLPITLTVTGVLRGVDAASLTATGAPGAPAGAITIACEPAMFIEPLGTVVEVTVRPSASTGGVVSAYEVTVRSPLVAFAPTT
jgi:hypothetical protein